MVTTTPEKIVSFEADSSANQDVKSAIDQMREKGKSYLESTVAAAQEHPWAAAAIGAGVVATVAATAYGASRLAKRTQDEMDNGQAPFFEDVVPMQAYPTGRVEH